MTTPRPHQREALSRLSGKDAYALLMAMRTGKTKVAIDWWVGSECSDLLVVAPAGSYRVWETELLKHLPSELYRETVIATWVSGKTSSKKNCEELLEICSCPRVLLVNVEALSTVDALYTICEKFLKQFGATMVVDESTTIRNPTSARTKKVLRLGPLAKKRLIMTGLVSPKSPLDLWAQFAFLDWRILGHQSFSTFKARYAIVKKICMLPTRALAARLDAATGGRPWEVPGVGRISASDLNRDGILAELERRKIYVQAVPVIEGYRHEEELRQKIEPWSFRVRLDDVREASPPVYVRREVALTDEQKRIYGELKRHATSEVSAGAHVTATAVISQILRLHQVVCGHVTDEAGGEHDIPERRTAELLSVLAEYDGKAVVWVSYDRDVERVVSALEKEYGEGSVARFWGGNRGTREDEELQFREIPMCRFMVATAAAGGRGRDWSCADLAVYYSNTYDLEHRSQSEERTEAVTKNYGATRVDLVAGGTVDEKIIEALRAKIDLAAVINGDSWREWLV